MHAFAFSDPANTAAFRQVVRRPDDGDGVGQALRQVFPQSTTLPADIARLLGRLNR